eukprot:m.210285 g.210285  ORF g.210285 m.210285 type:complete len:374 (-) comp33069_c1_seq2:176-1297(-)
MFGSSFFDQPAHHQPQWGYSSDPYARRSPFGQQQPRQQRQPRHYYSEAEMLEAQRAQRQEQQQRQQHAQRLQLQRERQAAAALQQHKEAALKRQEQIKQRTLFLIRAKIATRTIQRAWRAYSERRDHVLHAKREAAALVITRAMRNFPAIMQAKKVVKSLQELKHIAQQVEDVDPATAIKIGAGITLFEHTLDKLVAKIDVIDSWGSPLVRSRRKQIVLRANERITQVCHDAVAPETEPAPTSTTPTSTTSDDVQNSDQEVTEVQDSDRDTAHDATHNENSDEDVETTDETVDETVDTTFEDEDKVQQQRPSYAAIARQCQENVHKDLSNKLTSLIDQLKDQVEELTRNKDTMDTDTIESTITKLSTASQLLR